MIYLNTSPETIAKYITSGVESELHAAVKKELMAVAEKVVDEVSLDLAKKVKAFMAAKVDVRTEDIHVMLNIDGVKKFVEGEKE